MDSPVCFFTICTRSYAALAYALAASVREHHPDSTFTVWLADEGDPPEAADYIHQRPAIEALADDEFAELTYYYSTLELCTALKPRVFQQHLREGATRVVYLDPDILLFRPLDELLAPLEGDATGILTPHLSAPLPRDGLKPDDLVILQSGVFNLGFLALAASPSTDEFLAWWWGWLKSHCFTSKSEGTFTDQKWIDLAPILWPAFHVSRDPTCNVAYWNLPQRRLTLDDRGLAVEGKPLSFFHFSGFDPSRPERLSKHDTRSVVEPGTPLAELLESYSRRVEEHGHSELRRLPSGHVRFDNGIAFDVVAHHVYRNAVLEGRHFDDPSATGTLSFFAWLCEPLDAPVRESEVNPLTRYLLGIHELRPELQRALPDLWGADRGEFLHWVDRNAARELGANPDLLSRQQAGRRRFASIRSVAARVRRKWANR